jgi:hypothetical protein
MLREMIGVITAHEAGVGLFGEQAREYSSVGGCGLGAVDAILGVAAANSRKHCGCDN